MCDPSGAVVRGDGATKVSLWVQRWQRHISSWLHLSLSRQLLRQVVLPQAGRGGPLLLGSLTLGFLFLFHYSLP
jgi:hypothetical protein